MFDQRWDGDPRKQQGATATAEIAATAWLQFLGWGVESDGFGWRTHARRQAGTWEDAMNQEFP